MSPRDLKLYRATIECELPRSPLFPEKVGSIVNSHLLDYTDWAFVERGFALRNEEKRIRVDLLPDGVRADIESPSQEELEDFSMKTLALITTTLANLELRGVSNASFELRFFMPFEDEQELIAILVDKFFKVPNQYIQKFGDSIHDAFWGIAFLHDGFQCRILLYPLYKHEIKDIYPTLFEEFGTAGLAIRLTFETQPEQEISLISDLQALFATARKEAHSIASMTAGQILETD